MQNNWWQSPKKTIQHDYCYYIYHLNHNDDIYNNNNTININNYRSKEEELTHERILGLMAVADIRIDCSCCISNDC